MIDLQIITHYEDWWNRKNSEPLIYSIYPRENKDFKHAIKPWMAPQLTNKWSNWQQELMLGQAVELTWKTGKHHYIEDTIAFFEAYHEMTGQFDGRLVYHLDGPGEIPHLEQLCKVEKLHAIQCVPGAGNEHGASEAWFPLFKKILNGGKRICIGGCPNNPDVIRKLFEAFPKEEFFIPLTFDSESKAMELNKVLLN